jgi:hypothetical protein
MNSSTDYGFLIQLPLNLFANPMARQNSRSIPPATCLSQYRRGHSDSIQARSGRNVVAIGNRARLSTVYFSPD